MLKDAFATTGVEMRPGIRIKRAVVLGATILFGCLTGIDVQAASTTPTKMHPGDHKFELPHQGHARHYIVHVPPG